MVLLGIVRCASPAGASRGRRRHIRSRVSGHFLAVVDWAALQRGVDLPGIAAGKRNQQALAHVAQVHYKTSRNTFALLSSVAENEYAT
jgi:hypothetical protein